jgi:hypothetical protein
MIRIDSDSLAHLEVAMDTYCPQCQHMGCKAEEGWRAYIEEDTWLLRCACCDYNWAESNKVKAKDKSHAEV